MLDQRVADLPPPIQMSDALSRNLPREHKVVESNCIARGRRKIVDEVENFPRSVGTCWSPLGEVYPVEKKCREQGLSDEERLRVHQADSATVMGDLQKWMQVQLDEKRVEPNSGLGEAFNYVLKRTGWPSSSGWSSTRAGSRSARSRGAASSSSSTAWSATSTSTRCSPAR